MKSRISFKLERHELIIWLLSVAAVVLSFVLSAERDLLNLISSLIGVTALIYVAKGFIIGQALCIVFAVFYGIVSYHFSYYGEMITYLCMSAPTAIFSLIEWIRHPFKKTAEVEVASLSPKKIAVVSLATVLVTVAFWFILDFLGNANLLVSTFSVTTSFLASYLTVLRSPYYALAYAANDIVLIILWTLAAIEDISYLPMIVCFVAFLVNDMYGFINWKKMQKRQQA